MPRTPFAPVGSHATPRSIHSTFSLPLRVAPLILAALGAAGCGVNSQVDGDSVPSSGGGGAGHEVLIDRSSPVKIRRPGTGKTKLPCAPGLELCEGSCTDVASDPGNCGACGKPCTVVDGAGVECHEGACTLVCPEGHGDCDGDPSNGCEVDFYEGVDCGACGVTCPGGHVCSFGVCTEIPCPGCDQGIALWLDASIPSSISQDGEKRVSLWTDRSGNSAGATSDEGAEGAKNGPLYLSISANSLPSLRFDGAAIRLSTAPMPVPSQITTFLVYRMNDPALPAGSLLAQGQEANWSVGRAGSTSMLSFQVGSGSGGPSLPIESATWSLMVSVQDAGNARMYTLGASSVFPHAPIVTGSGAITIGNSAVLGQPCGCDIAEAMVYPSALPLSKIDTVMEYLREKYTLL